MLDRPQVKLVNKLRLVMLYALRYEEKGHSELSAFQDKLRLYGADQFALRSISDLIEYAGAQRRGGDLFSNKNFLSAFKKSMQRELVGVSNVYTQHKPLLDSILDQLSKGRLKDSAFPFLDASSPKDKAQDVIIFIVGGATYEESFFVDQFNKTNAGMRVILGGSTIHNSASFLGSIKAALGVADVL